MSITLFVCHCELQPPMGNEIGMKTAAHFMNGIFLVFNIIAWSLCDGWQISYKAKIFFGLWLIADLCIFYFELYFIDMNDDLFINPFGFLSSKDNVYSYDISVRNTGLSSAANLLVFLLVQIRRYWKYPNEYHLVPQHATLMWKDKVTNQL